jgi:3-methyladenine DNA glycosylase/8-oxoguanine DNA glycosylase
MRALREPDAFPAGDLGLRKAMGVPGALLSERALRAAAESWRPWRSYAAILLWGELGATAPARSRSQVRGRSRPTQAVARR